MEYENLKILNNIFITKIFIIQQIINKKILINQIVLKKNEYILEHF